MGVLLVLNYTDEVLLRWETLVCATVMIATSACADILGIRRGEASGGGALSSVGMGGTGGAASGGMGGTGLCDYAKTVLGDDPAAYWRLDEPSGAGVTDLVDTYPGQYFEVDLGEMSLVPNCPNSKAVRFTNTSAYVELGPVLTFGDQVPFTVEVWVDIGMDTDAGSIVSSFDGSAGWLLSYTNSGNIRFRRVTGPSQDVTTLVDLGVHHVVARFESTRVCLLVNGGEPLCSPSRIVPLDTTPKDLRFSDSTYNGGLDEVAIYATALSTTQVQAHYEAAQR